MTDDIVGNVVAEDGSVDSASVRIFAQDPDSSGSRELGRYVWGLGTLYMPAFQVIPVFRLDRIGRGGDHSPYIQAGWPGLRFTERLENYKRQHLPTDDLEHVNFGYVASRRSHGVNPSPQRLKQANTDLPDGYVVACTTVALPAQPRTEHRQHHDCSSE